MAKKKRSEKHIHTVQAINKKDVHQRTTQPKAVHDSRWVIPFILLLTFLAFIPVLQAGFVNWDDGDYIKDNPLIKNFSNFKSLVTTPVQGNYHPLTMLSIRLNYLISGLNAWSYHLLNLGFHLINCFLVFRLAMLLSYR